MLCEITEACNADDKSPQLYLLFKKFVKQYIEEDVLALITAPSSREELLENLVK